MKAIRKLEFYTGSKEENLPDFNPEFPYIASRAELDYYRELFVPWHWHKAIELFYIESGEVTYCTPNGTIVFPTGSGGMVNSGVLHMTRIQTNHAPNVQFLHIFDPGLISGRHGSIIEQKYVTPIIADSQLEIISLDSKNPIQEEILQAIRQAFCLSENEFGYELKIREAISDIWLRILQLSSVGMKEKEILKNNETDKLKLMMVYIHEHYAEKIAISKLASIGFLSERECYRVFQNCLHMTPLEYLTGYRLQRACQMLAESRDNITDIGHGCGLGNSSYFGKTFREHMGCTPLEYRKRWQNSNKDWQK